jgi:hypothetical protein
MAVGYITDVGDHVVVIHPIGPGSQGWSPAQARSAHQQIRTRRRQSTGSCSAETLEPRSFSRLLASTPPHLPK